MKMTAAPEGPQKALILKVSAGLAVKVALKRDG